jgi:hypothetical protein
MTKRLTELQEEALKTFQDHGTSVIETSEEAILDFVTHVYTQAVEQTEKAYGGCRNCYGKGYSTEMQGGVTAGRYTVSGPKRVMNMCTCERGKQLQALLPK